jgi:hypothetical protein
VSGQHAVPWHGKQAGGVPASTMTITRVFAHTSLPP